MSDYDKTVLAIRDGEFDAFQKPLSQSIRPG